MAAPRELLGTVACFNPNCGVDVPVKKSAGGAVAASCPYCDLQVYGKDGTQAKADILRLMKLIREVKPPAVEPPAPIAPPVTVKAVAKPAASTIFG